jgi:hypothetical protein
MGGGMIEDGGDGREIFRLCFVNPEISSHALL